jgi:hypothetical protein
VHITELLITGFDGDEPVFAVHLTPDTATIGSTGTDENGETELKEARLLAADAFEAIYEILERLPKVPASASS